MLKYYNYKRKASDENVSNDSNEEINLANLPADPGRRTPILKYDPNVRDQVRRAYLQKGPYQPQKHKFPQLDFSGTVRRFNPVWFDEYPSWLEYSIAENAAYCLCCYLYKPSMGDLAGGDAFIGDGFQNWKKKEKLKTHVGEVNSAHYFARRKCETLLNQKQHIHTHFFKQTDKVRSEYRTRLNASVDVTRYLLRQGLAFRGHNQSDASNSKGNFLELLHWYADRKEEVNTVTLNNAPGNIKLTSPDIQKDIVNASATETINVIIRDIGDKLFSILIDESRDVSGKEQIAIVLRYVNNGNVFERFLGVEHVTETTALKLKEVIDGFFSRHRLSISRLRGQGYDGASNMKGEFNGLKTLILKENKCAYYIHCFAYQLQLALVAVAKNYTKIAALFILIANVVTVAGGSCKRRDILRKKHAAKVIEALDNGEILSGWGLNQEVTLKRPGDTRWGSHYGTLISVISMFSTIIELLEKLKESGDSDHRYEAERLQDAIQTFDFVFSLHLMRTLLGFTNHLSQALQRKDQDIVNAMNLVKVCKQNMQNMRENGWDSLLGQVVSFCENNDIDVPNMDDMFYAQGKSKRKASKITNLHNYRVELFCAVIDMLLQELNSRFSETSTELLLSVASLSPVNSFSAFDKQNLILFAQFYLGDFSATELLGLEDELETYISDLRHSSEFSDLNGISNLARKMVETKRNMVYPLVYLLLTLALILSVATATVERVFSAMNLLKTDLCNKMGDSWMNDNMILYIEKDIYDTVDNETIMQTFQNMKTRRGQL